MSRPVGPDVRVLAFIVAAHADSKQVGAPAGAVPVTLSEFAITHAEGPNGMFGMVTTFIVDP